MLAFDFISFTSLFLTLLGTFQDVQAHPYPLQSRQEKSTGLYIASIRDGSCLSIPGSTPTIGSRIISSTDCENAETWHVPNGNGLLGLDTVALVWDRSDKGNIILNEPIKNSTSQSWLWSYDNRISTSDGTACLEQSSSGPLRADCDPENLNQVWILRNTSYPPNIEDIPKQQDVIGQGYIHPFGRKDICLAGISNSSPYAGVGVAMTYCSGKGDGSTMQPVSTSQSLMKWNLPLTGKEGHVKLSGSNFCLESGLKVLNGTNTGYDYKYQYGMGVRIEPCDENEDGQQWLWDGKLLKLSKSLDQCLNILGGSGPIQQTNFLNLRPMQLWTCDQEDENSVSSAPTFTSLGVIKIPTDHSN
ncbi:uncharacterized protein IL334_003938 [Kwoniella shivajii]|uniref:Ricin B lectin domain-containing protein n=1 Tax=Kwoniella shivajii TaxID=564305 RepID=A0ABZ1CZJ3_9TREE|nr:hypothetical protein IL334_003938 [Kwoniella shivajii]